MHEKYTRYADFTLARLLLVRWPRTSQRRCKIARQHSSSTFNACLVSINPGPMSILASSSSSFSPLSRALEHQHQPPTSVTPISLLLSPYPLYHPYTPYSCHPIPYTVIFHRTSIQCSTSCTVDPKPQALEPTPLALKSIPHPPTTNPAALRHESTLNRR